MTTRLPRLLLLLTCLVPTSALASGTLVPIGSGQKPASMRDHAVRVTINNGFARTEVTQRFYNPNTTELEAIYSFPIPESASLSEMTIWAGERVLSGEVVTRADADRIYEREKSQGNDVGKAEKRGLQTFDFYVSPVPPQAETRMQFVYYQPIELDGTVGRYVYPLENGGTDDKAPRFWQDNDVVEESFSFEVELKSSIPIKQVRVPGFEDVADVQHHAEGHVVARVEKASAQLNRDMVFYYRLPDDVPGQVDLMTYKPDADKPGTFMLVATPGLDLQPLTRGADYVFVLDISGSMQGKLETLLDGVSKGLGKLRLDDRFRVVTFNNQAVEITSGWQPVEQNAVASCLNTIRRQGANGSTNMYAGIRLGLRDLDADRATSVVLVTDAVTNTGVVDPAKFADLLRTCDVRVFGFQLGNSGNWPLLRLICDQSGGFSQQVSNADDIYGQVLLAQGKVTHECLHDASLEIKGVDVFDTTDLQIDKVYRGQQLRIFGRYGSGGEASVRLLATLTGADKVYETSFEFPNVSLDDPEIERLWAMERIEEIEMLTQLGKADRDEAATAIASIGVQYQLVTDETSMVVLPDEAYAQYGIERRNQQRVQAEQSVQQARKQTAPQPRRVDRKRPMFNNPIPRPSSGGGALSPLGLGLLLAPLALVRRTRED